MNQQNQNSRPDTLSITPPLWVLIFIASLFIVVCVGLWGYVLVTRQAVLPAATPSVVFVLQTPDNPVTAVPSPTPLIFETPDLGPTATLPPGPSAGQLNVGALVEVTGTDGDSLRLRSGPGLSTETIYLALSSEVFFVVDGPIEADGFRWWKLAAQADEQREGWGVENFLGLIRTP
jgi:hypothetical protein